MARKKKSKGLRVSLMLTVGLMIVSFAAGMLTQKIVFREPQTDAGLTYIEDIPVMTDFLPEAHAPVRDRSARSSISSSTRPTTPAPAQMQLRTTRSSTRTPTPEEGIVSWHYTVDYHEIYHHLPDDETAYHAGDGMEKNGGNMNGIGIEMCVNSDGNYEQTLINTEKLCARLLIEYDLNPSKALKKHQDFSGKICPSTLINSGRWDEFCSAVTAKYKELKADEAAKAS